MEPSGNKHILIIEDDTFIAELYAHILESNNFEVKVGNTGKSGLDLLKNENFDLVLLDIVLPDMNGLEVLHQWKLKKPNSDTIVLLLTNLGQDEVIKKGFELGAHGYLIKSSLSPEQVVSEVNTALSQKVGSAT